MICPPGKPAIFYRRANMKYWVTGQTWDQGEVFVHGVFEAFLVDVRGHHGWGFACPTQKSCGLDQGLQLLVPGVDTNVVDYPAKHLKIDRGGAGNQILGRPDR